jgi:hypothetical protein
MELLSHDWILFDIDICDSNSAVKVLENLVPNREQLMAETNALGVITK